MCNILVPINWLSSIWATIDCYRRRVTIFTLGGDCFIFIGYRLDVINPYLSDHRDRESIVCLLASLSLFDVGGRG